MPVCLSNLIYGVADLSISGSLSELALAREWGVMVGCLVLIAVLMVTILGGVGLGIRSVLKILHQTIDGYNKLTLSIDRLSDSQDDLQNWLKSQTKELQDDIDGIEESIKNDHSMLLDHETKINEHSEQIKSISKKRKGNEE